MFFTSFFLLMMVAAIAGLLTVFTAYDMMRINRRRKTEFIEAQKKMEADSLEAARLAYMRGDATEGQIELVDYVNERAANTNTGFKIPNILGPPTAVKVGDEDTDSSSSGAAHASAAAAAAAVPEQIAQERTAVGRDVEGAQQKKSWLRSWLYSNLKREEEGESLGSSQRRLGWESLSEDDDGSGVRDSDVVRAVESRQAYLKEQAKVALDKEKENQRTGGPLDRVGLQDQKPETKSRSWWWSK